MTDNVLFPNIEPPNGDFIAYLEKLIGPGPDHDVEAMARVVAERLAQSPPPAASVDDLLARQTARDNAAGRSSMHLDSPGRVTGAAGQAQAAPLAPPRPASPAGMPGASGRQSGPPELIEVFARVADQLKAGSGARVARAGLAGIGRLILFAGIALMAAAVILGDQIPELSVAPGVMLAVIGTILRNIAGGPTGATKVARKSTRHP
ncbi:MAG: hypothetical protein R3E83_01435 [Burkholderiaceae bacterium]